MLSTPSQSQKAVEQSSQRASHWSIDCPTMLSRELLREQSDRVRELLPTRWQDVRQDEEIDEPVLEFGTEGVDP